MPTLPPGESLTSGNLALLKFVPDFRNWGEGMNANLDAIDAAVTALEEGEPSGTISGINTIAFTTGPALSASCAVNMITLTASVTSSTWPAGSDGQEVGIIILQDSVGGHTWTWPTNVRGGGTIDTTAETLSTQKFVYVVALDKWVTSSVMQVGI